MGWRAVIRPIPGPGTATTDLPPDCLPESRREYNPRRPVPGGGVTLGTGRTGRPRGGRHSEERRAQWRLAWVRKKTRLELAGNGKGKSVSINMKVCTP